MNRQTVKCPSCAIDHKRSYLLHLGLDTCQMDDTEIEVAIEIINKLIYAHGVDATERCIIAMLDLKTKPLAKYNISEAEDNVDVVKDFVIAQAEVKDIVTKNQRSYELSKR